MAEAAQVDDEDQGRRIGDDGVQPDAGAPAGERLAWPDLMRVLAVFAVIVIHTSAVSVISKRKLPPLDWWLANFADASVRWAVPCFVMLSGALLLYPMRTESMSAFYRRRLRRVFVPIAFWTAIYLALPGWREQPLTPEQMLVKLVRGHPGFHLWYIFMIPGLYLFMPFLRRFVAAASRVERRAAIVSILAVGSVHMLLSSTSLVSSGVSVFSTFVPYTGYLLLGHELVRSGGWRWSRKLLWSGMVACVLAIALSAHISTDLWGPFHTRPAYHPLSPMVILLSILVFEAVRGLSESRLSRVKGVLAHLGAMSLGIYLIHPLWLDAWADATHNFGDLPVVATLFIQPVAVFVASYLSVFAISSIPLARRVVV